mmetsp:Transcript_33900/g.39446  ORF Transcript_33900/g.39446 Transcript_33900/m.39446 type:complete len:208 (-) Transcript_33900:683-1306(-)
MSEPAQLSACKNLTTDGNTTLPRFTEFLSICEANAKWRTDGVWHDNNAARSTAGPLSIADCSEPSRSFSFAEIIVTVSTKISARHRSTKSSAAGTSDGTRRAVGIGIEPPLAEGTRPSRLISSGLSSANLIAEAWIPVLRQRRAFPSLRKNATGNDSLVAFLYAAAIVENRSNRSCGWSIANMTRLQNSTGDFGFTISFTAWMMTCI